MDERRSRHLLRYDYQGLDAASLKHSLANRMIYSVGKDSYTATERDWFHAFAYVVRDRLTERWMETMRSYYRADAKRVYYLSLEFLIGRSLGNSLLNLDMRDDGAEALRDLGLDLEALESLEFDAALGNGGLGRLAACFLDSMATLRIPGYGYGIRYEYGMFRQAIEQGRQVEHPDNWLRYGNPWEFPRPEVLYPVRFFGRLVEYADKGGTVRHHWVETEEVMAMAYDTPIPGYGVDTVNNMRLWSAKASRDFNLKFFNEGDYIKAVEGKTRSENLSKVLYPSDTTREGRELRLMQQYFFVSASLQDILHRFQKHHNRLDRLPEKVAIQLNDTHPAIAIPELMRLLVDEEGVGWEEAWEITRNTFAYTNHTLLPEALESWPVPLLEGMLPRHLQLIYEINHHFLEEVRHRYPGDVERLRRMSLIDETGERHVRMGHLAVVGSHTVNGVAAIHSRLVQERLFADFHQLSPEKFINITNGVTPRRWLNHANPELAQVITDRIGAGWQTDLERLAELMPLADEPDLQRAFRAVKQNNKHALAARIERQTGIRVGTDALFDVQIKRIHEYKRQLLNLLHVITLYNRIRAGAESVPRVVLFGGKAAPSYRMAKQIIRLINDAADVINNDPAVGDRLKVVFLPNYDVSSAEQIIPAADLSEQISTAGTEASGTSNMKLALNGALTIGTLDGANVEICERVGGEDIFIFGLTVEEVTALRSEGYDPWHHYREKGELREVLEMIRTGFFSPEAPERYREIFDSLTEGGDHYLLLADYADYVATQERVAEHYRDPDAWARSAIRNVAGMGYFSSDRTIAEYAERVWGVTPVHRHTAAEEGR